MLIVQMEQRVNLKFKLGKAFSEAYAMLKEVYGKGRETPKTIRAPDGPQRQKRTKTLKKTVPVATL
ncbi:hypothetical protein NQ318_016011 [Aromia moschata]|uniref:Uncharacterized protein n=1 Tax=Aromia moschata TaxID=1265417 RepID=A0AAV8XK59_9CUCU|nr:hypothetical protein NQ318_016011 [Aromia moschata]